MPRFFVAGFFVAGFLLTAKALGGALRATFVDFFFAGDIGRIKHDPIRIRQPYLNPHQDFLRVAGVGGGRATTRPGAQVGVTAGLRRCQAVRSMFFRSEPWGAFDALCVHKLTLLRRQDNGCGMRRFGMLLVIAALCIVQLGAQRPLWRARRCPNAPLPNRLADARVQVADWKPEAGSPKNIDPARFASAVAELCVMPNVTRARTLGDALLQAAGEFDIDPFLLGALVFRGSYCRPDYQNPLGVGLTALPMRMYEGDFRHGGYQYQTHDVAGWTVKQKALSRFPFVEASLRRSQANLYFAAGLLSVWREQHAAVDEQFEQVPHRHFVSHWFWGDRVKSARDEDRVFTDRRRLLGYYGAFNDDTQITFRGVVMGCPLDGAPRVVSSGLGFERSEGRSHRGVDVESEFGEPVHAIADGLVVFSGVDLPGQHQHLQLTVEETNKFARAAFGHGGRYVCIQHAAPTGPPLRSCYMHLNSVEVAYGAKVQRGDRIGRVGRTGVKTSPPHLHLELMALDELLDPLVALHGPLIGVPIAFEP